MFHTRWLAPCRAHSKCLINVHAYRNIWRLNCCSLTSWRPMKIPVQTCVFSSPPPKPPTSMCRTCLQSPLHCLRGKKKKFFPLAQKFCQRRRRNSLLLPSWLPTLSPRLPPPPSSGRPGWFASSLAVLRIQKQEIMHHQP